MTKLQVHREFCLNTDHLLWAFEIFVDGESVGKISNGKTEVFPIAPGDHKVEIGVSHPWTKFFSEPFQVTAEDDSEVKMTIRRNGNFFTRGAIWNIALNLANSRRMYRIEKG